MEDCRWVEWVQEMKAEDMVSLCFIPQDNYPLTATFLGLIVGSSCTQVIYSGGGMLVINQPRAHHMATDHGDGVSLTRTDAIMQYMIHKPRFMQFP